MTEAIFMAELPVVLTNGNDGRGGRWFSSANVRKKIEKTLRMGGFDRSNLDKFPPGVTLTLTRVIGKGGRLWDSDSIGRGNAKELIDALVALGWFVDDGPRWIVETRYRQIVDRKKVPCVLVEITK